MSHTPGPWYTTPVGGDHGQHLVIAEDSGATVAVIYNDNDDAHLVVAAPDMFEALRKMIEHRERDCLDNTIEPYASCAAALRKAKP